MNDEEFKHLPLHMRPIAARDKEERIKWIKAQGRWISYPAATKIHDRLLDVLTQPRSRRMQNILIFGDSGIGKTALIDEFIRTYHLKEASADASSKNISKRHPIIKVLMPADPDHRDLYRGILRAVGIPYLVRNHLNVIRLQDIVRNLLQTSGTQLLVIDEINSLLAGTPAKQRLFLQHLRYISNDLGLALVCIGTPEARYALNSDPQLRRRFSDIELRLWEDGDALREFFNNLVKSMPLKQPSPVDSPVIRQLMVAATKGITDSMCRAVENVAIAAIEAGREMIDQGSFQTLWSDPPFASSTKWEDFSAGKG